MTCRHCKSTNLTSIINLGDMPIAHRLLEQQDEAEETFPLSLHVCNDCGLIQILDPIDPAILYAGFNYNFSSWKPEPHLPHEIETIIAKAAPKKVLEIGCNDGLFLSKLVEHDIEMAVGIELNPVPAAIARDRGLEVINEAVSLTVGRRAVDKYGAFDLVVARQVLEHVLDFDAFFACVDESLNPEGCLFIDVPDFTDLLALGDCSGIWEEHPTYFTQTTLSNLLGSHGFEIIHQNSYDFSGGCFSVLAKRATVNKQAFTEDIAPAYAFSNRVDRYGKALKDKLSQAHAKGTKVVLYGVGCRACTLVNGLGLGEFIDYAVDDQEQRQGKFMPGSRLPVYPSNKMREEAGNVLCLLAVNNENEGRVSAKFRDRPSIDFHSIFGPIRSR